MSGDLIRWKDAGHGTFIEVQPGVPRARGPAVIEQREEYASEFEAIRSIAAKLGIGSAETLRKWVRRAEVDSGVRPGVTTPSTRRSRRSSGRTPSCAARTRS